MRKEMTNMESQQTQPTREKKGKNRNLKETMNYGD